MKDNSKDICHFHLCSLQYIETASPCSFQQTQQDSTLRHFLSHTVRPKVVPHSHSSLFLKYFSQLGVVCCRLFFIILYLKRSLHNMETPELKETLSLAIQLCPY